MDWNVIVTVQEQGFKKAREFLRGFGKVNRTDFFNVLIMQVDNVDGFMEDINAAIAVNKDVLNVLGRISPVTHTFVFQSPQQFEERAREIVAQWIPLLSDRRFHVRMHRRGFKGRLSSQSEEMFLDHSITESFSKEDKSMPVINFDDPDFVITVETIGQKAGLAIWAREQLQRYPFLKVD